MKTTGLLLLALGVLSVWDVVAEVKPAPIFSDNMVLQRDMPVPVWGTAEAGTQVTVAFAGQTLHGTADAAGTWRVLLAPMKADATGRDLVIKDDRPEGPGVTCKNVRVGEVWFTAGQSNMGMSLGQSTGGSEGVMRLDACQDLWVAPLSAQPDPSTDTPRVWKAQWRKADGGYSAVSGFFAEKLYRQLGGTVPVGMITAVAISPAEAWVDAPSLEASPELRGLLKSPLKQTAKCYNDVIAQLGPFAIRGVIYYQGEYNGGRGLEFEVLMTALIKSWRAAFERPDLPFLFVQLPGFIEHRAEKDQKLDMDDATLAKLKEPMRAGVWTDIREAQFNVWRSVPKTGMAVAIDVGDPYDIHPKQKEPIADRLLLSARKIAYGQKIEGDSPVPVRIELEKDRFIVTFEHVGDGLTVKGGIIEGFDVAGEDLVLKPAQARLDGNNRVMVWHPQVTKPAILHYAWGSFPRCTLYNSMGLPAVPFRHLVRDQIHASDGAQFSFRNPSFEDAPSNHAEQATGWSLGNGTVRTQEKTSAGAWALKMSAVNSGASQDDIVRGFGSFWNSDPQLPFVVRPGCVNAYSVDMAVKGDAPLTAYLRLCHHSNASANEFWGSPLMPKTASPAFVRRHMASEFRPVFAGVESDTAGTLLSRSSDQAGTNAALFLDNLSEVTLLRPALGLSDASPILLPDVKPGASVASQPRTISNKQGLTALRQLDEGSATDVPTVLYGLASAVRSEPVAMQRVNKPSDDVGAILIGEQAGHFEFVSTHQGPQPQALRLIGADNASGLRGGRVPESEELVIRFTGADKPGEYKATVRVVTQAMNIGILSAADPGEPPLNLHYVDIPVRVKVAP